MIKIITFRSYTVVISGQTKKICLIVEHFEYFQPDWNHGKNSRPIINICQFNIASSIVHIFHYFNTIIEASKATQ